uniref:RING finger protein 215 n=1 Tax=Chrysemys picta bellii TaxID=8478 RepID=A0A8C3FKA8_CHRPI
MARLLLPVLLGHVAALGPSLAGPAAARVEVLALREPEEAEPRSPAAGGYTLQGALLGGRPGPDPPPREEAIEGSLLLMGDAEPELEGENSWIAVVPVGEEQAEIPRGSKEESFTAAMVNKMKRALVLGASALLILVLNQNTIREVGALCRLPVTLPWGLSGWLHGLADMSVVFHPAADGCVPGALQACDCDPDLRQCHPASRGSATGVTLTLWSTCGLSRGGLYGEWQGVICTGENSSRVQKYLQQLWNTILFIALILCTGVIVQAQRQSRQGQQDQDTELDLKQHILRRLSALKTRRYHPGKHPWSQARDIDSCAVCLDQFHKNQCLRVLPCSHEFHRDCVDPWLLLQQTCPLCKHNILGESGRWHQRVAPSTAACAGPEASGLSL